MSCKRFNILSLMNRWGSKREMMGDDPPYLAVGTEVSAKYKGAFCEAKVRKIVRSVKCKIAYKLGLGTAVVTDDQIKGTLRAGSVVEVKHSDKKEYVEATIIKIQDCSQYTVVFDDGDITTLRRTALCLKSGRHFAESETLDQLPLTHPEHFGNPVIGGRRGRRTRHDESSDDEDSSKKLKQPKEEKEADIGKVVCVEISEKKKQKDNWFPGLVVAPTAQDTVKINVKEDYLVRSFKDGRYYTVPKKEATPFTREIGQKVDNNTLRTAVEKALLFLDRDELPPHWDRELLFGLNEITDTDSDAALDSDTSDDEPREEKDHFVAQLYKFMDDRGTPINKGPTINGRDVDLYKLFKVVHKLGGYNRVTNHNQWKTVSHKLGFGQIPTSVNLVKHAYKKFLHSFEDFYRKLGCTMVNHPRGHRARHRSGRTLIRDKDKAVPTITKDKLGEKEAEDKEESVTEPNKERETSKEEVKSKEGLSELKPLRESRKDFQKPKNEKVDKKEDVKVVPTVSKSNDPPAVTKFTREDRSKLDDREERLKMRELVKLDNNAKDESKGESNSRSTKDLKSEESQRFVKITRREVKDNKKDEKEKEDKCKIASEREVRPKKAAVSNPVEAQCSSEHLKAKKSRSLFSKITGSKRIKPMSDSKIPRASKPLGLNSVRQKRTFSERMKAMVKKFKMKTGVKHLRHKSPHPPDIKESEDKKKPSAEDSAKAIIPQLTRSKSKEEVSSKTRKPEISNERKPISSHPSHLERRQSYSKKRKDDDKSTGHDEPLDLLPNYKSVAVGDKLKVYYGPTHESKVTYEAKVLSSKEQDSETMYLVHYTGWNTRYDEWIKRGRIADNLSWSPGRAKRTRQHSSQQSGSAGCSSRSVKRSKGGSGGEAGGVVGARSTTPSSVTSSSSRTKSPAVSGVPRSSRSRARTRRASAHTHTDLSDTEGDDDYESDDLDVVRVHVGKDVCSDQHLSSEEKESKDVGELLMEKMRSRTYRPVQRRRMESGGDAEDMHTEPKRIKDESEEEGRTRSRSERKKIEEITKGVSEDAKKEVGDLPRSDRLRNKRKVVEEKPDSGDEREIKQDGKNEESKSLKHVQEDKRRSDLKVIEIENIESDDSKKKIKRKTDDGSFEEENKESQTSERRRSKRVTPKKEDSKIFIKDEDNNDQPKGREFDLNQIRSELKGIASNSKASVEVVTLTGKEEDEEKIDVENKLDNKASESKTIMDSSLEDVYEFKEPEPFEFEVRSKCGDEKGNKLQRRTFGRMCEESHSNSPGSVKRKFTRMKSGSPNSFDNNKSIKNQIVKLSDEENDKIDSDFEYVETNKKDQKKSSCPCSPEQKQKDITEADKKEEILPKTACNKIDKFLQPLSLFSELPEEEEAVIVEEDSDSRLIASEPDTEGESQGPLFSHQQRDHEDLFPTSITQSSSVENSQNKSPFSGFSERFDGNENKVDENSRTKKEEEQEDDGDNIEDDPIQSAIKRVQRAFSQSTGDEDSNDIDLLSELPDPTNKRDSFMSVIKEISSDSESSRESNESHNDVNLEGQNSQSNHSIESEEIIQISNCSLIEEINLDSNDSDCKVVPEDKDVLENKEEAVNKQATVEVKEDAGNSKEVLENVVEVKKEFKFEVAKEGDDQIKDCTKIVMDIEVKEEIVDDGQVVENPVVVTCTKEETEEEIEEQIEEMDEEVLLETIGVKKPREEDVFEEEGNEDNEVVETAEMVEEAQNEKLKEEKMKEEVCEVEEAESNLESLLCEETIPGSPAPSSSVAVENPPTSNSPELPFASAAGPPTYKAPPPPPPLPPPPPPITNEAAPVMENTPPTTPESSLSPISNSPRGEQSGSSPVPENESSKSNRDSSEVDMDSFPVATKISHYSEEDTNCGVGNTNNTSLKKAGLPEESESSHGIKKRRRSHKRSEENVKRIKMSHRSPRHSNVGSESDDDTSENSLELVSLQSRSPRPSKYNFFVQLDPELDGSQRIAVLQQKLTELRKTYMSVKAELAGIDRRRKKLRRREREASVKTNSKSEVPCS